MVSDEEMEPLRKAVWEWPLYISDNDEVTCYKDGCIEPNFIPWPRRKTFGDLSIDLIKHIIDIHGGIKI